VANVSPLSIDPYPWLYDGQLLAANTALSVIDMQIDFCGVGGYVDKMGYDLTLTRSPIAPIRSVLATLRPFGFQSSHARGPSSRPGRPPRQQTLALATRWRRHR
jgi:biuret amidohydrolase